MEDARLERQFYRPVCNEAEIDRILDVRNAHDYLLKLRAETIVDHMRLFRVYRNMALASPTGWSLEESFDATHYRRFLAHAGPDVAHECSGVTYGNLFSNDPDGKIFATEYGPLITISEGLRYFLKFAHLALLEFTTEVPMQVRMGALRIAIRVMLKTEAMDSYMDPRGIIPKNVADSIHAPIPLQLEFIAGHEFSHHLLGHLATAPTVDRPVYRAISSRDEDYKPLPTFSRSQKQELAADKQAIDLLQKDARHRSRTLDAALVWFGCLELYEAVTDYMYPSSPWPPPSHPSARQRFENLLESASPHGNRRRSHWREFLKRIDEAKVALMEDVSFNMETYEMYGSVYLDRPNSEWRGPALTDRKDYY